MKDPKFLHIPLGWQQFCNREAIFDTLTKTTLPNLGTYNYLEIGAASAVNMRGICMFLEQELKLPSWNVIGIDIKNGWCFQPDACAQNLAPWFIPCSSVQQADSLPPNHATVLDCGSLHFLSNTSLSFNAVFIDGCHSAVCSAQDFILAEPTFKPGAAAIFHDADALQQGPDFDVQPHCSQGIGVRIALSCLDLLNNKRPGWSSLHDVTPDYPNCLSHHSYGESSPCRGVFITQAVP